MASMNTKERSVFEVYADEYDLITNAAQREAGHAREVAAMIARFRPGLVLDAGCASGLTTLLFAREGIAAVGLDRSRKMIEVARRARQPEGLPILYRQGSFERLPKSLHGEFDLVVCLANSISGVGTLANLAMSLKNFHAVLRPGGSLVLQMLNYAAVEENTILPIKATRNGDIVYERFSERQGSILFIYVTRADFGQTPPKFEVFRHAFENFSPEQVLKGVEKAGFADIRRFADLQFTKKFGCRSRDLVLTGRRRT